MNADRQQGDACAAQARARRLPSICVLALPWVAAAFLASLAFAGSTFPARPATILTVSTTGDVVNGDVSSPTALVAKPGPDGISLREAILATNARPGPHTITFAPALAGQTISPMSPLPVLVRNGFTLSGLTGAGRPDLTLSGERLEGVPPPVNVGDRGLLTVRASGITIRRLRFVRVPQTWSAITIRIGGPAAPRQIAGVRIHDNVFSNEGGDATAYGVSLGSEPEGVADAKVSSVMIARNTFDHYLGDATVVHLQAGGTNSLIENVVIHDNAFTDSTFPVELVPFAGTGNRIVGTQILRNTFTSNHQPISIGTVGRDGSNEAAGNLVENTLIAGNTFSQNKNPAVEIVGGLINATGNVVRDTRIVNNAMAAGGLIDIVGGRSGGSRNRVEGVQIVNNTIVRDDGGAGLAIQANAGGTENSVSGVAVSNTIFWGRDDDFFGEVTPAMIRFSIVSTPRFAGANGNVLADPKLVDPAQGNYHLRPGSPAIDAGTSDGAPSSDFGGLGRYDDPATPNRGAGAIPYVDIGAYEFGGTPRPALTVSLTELDGATGAVTSAPAGIDCPTLCTSDFDPGAAVTLTASPWPGSRFAGWSGACSGASACMVTVDAAKSVTATFAPATYTVSVSIVGKGRVTSTPAGITCPSRCGGSFAAGSALRLRAIPAKGYRFAGWGGKCKGKGGCVVRVDANRKVRATFGRR